MGSVTRSFCPRPGAVSPAPSVGWRHERRTPCPPVAVRAGRRTRRSPRSRRRSAAIAAEAGIDDRLKELVQIHVSQLNGCAYCVRVHVERATRRRVTRRRDRAAAGVAGIRRLLRPRARRPRARRVRSRSSTRTASPTTSTTRSAASSARQEYVALSWILVSINAFNRIAIAGRYPVPPRDDLVGEDRDAARARPGDRRSASFPAPSTSATSAACPRAIAHPRRESCTARATSRSSTRRVSPRSAASASGASSTCAPTTRWPHAPSSSGGLDVADAARAAVPRLGGVVLRGRHPARRDVPPARRRLGRSRRRGRARDRSPISPCWCTAPSARTAPGVTVALTLAAAGVDERRGGRRLRAHRGAAARSGATAGRDGAAGDASGRRPPRRPRDPLARAGHARRCSPISPRATARRPTTSVRTGSATTSWPSCAAVLIEPR